MNDGSVVKVGIIGYGGRIQGVLGLMQRLSDKVRLVAITDVRNSAIRQQMSDNGHNPDSIRFYTDADDMLDKEELDGVMVGTRCSLHSVMGVKVLRRNLPLYLEKPVATNMIDLLALRDAGSGISTRVVVSFPLRMTPLVKLAAEIIESGKIGTVEHVQAWNNVPYGAVYYQDWYRDENETQGLWLQKATHDFDYINYLLKLRPSFICAMTSKQIMKGNHPAGLRCDDCEEQDTCLESPFHTYYTRSETPRVQPSGRLCAFAVDTGNEDSGSAIIRYESGMHACYSQNFFARNASGKRGATLLGYKGTIEFDWYTDEVKVYMHHVHRVESYKTQTASASHGGGDTVLADNFLRLMRGEQESVSPLNAGLLSVLMCLKAKESAATNTFQQICYPDGVAPG